MRNSKPILLVEYNNVGVMKVEHAHKNLKLRNHLVSMSNGEQASEYQRTDGNKKSYTLSC